MSKPKPKRKKILSLTVTSDEGGGNSTLEIEAENPENGNHINAKLNIGNDYNIGSTLETLATTLAQVF